MDLIDSVNDVKMNLDTLEVYRNSRQTAYREFYKGLIKRGRCFVAYEWGGNIHFAPSRFIGYKNNDMNSHMANDERDGRVTNRAINKIMRGKVEPSEIMEAKYQRFCNELDIQPCKFKKKFWRI